MKVQKYKVKAKIIKKHVLGFYHKGKDPMDRYNSWKYCFRFFQQLKIHPAFFKKKLTNNVACLHLGFYLASWGMYRGSSFLVKKSFLIHRRPIKELLKMKYNELWNANIVSLSKPKTINTIFKMAETLKKLYNNTITDTLITKILLGTIGCTPAYDRYFKKGCEKYDVRPYSNLSKNSLRVLIRFYQTNCKVFTSINKIIKHKSGILYPPMKLLDMFFYSVGRSKM